MQMKTKKHITLLITLNTLFVTILLIEFYLSPKVLELDVISALMIDSTSPWSTLFGTLIILTTLTYPFITITSIYLTWRHYYKNNLADIIWMASIPIINVILFTTALLYEHY